MDIVILALLVPTLTAGIVGPILLYGHLQKHRQAETEKLRNAIDTNLAAGVKLLEVRNYYDETSAALKKMLQEAYKEGNRFRQDQIRKLVDRLDALKARALDKTVRILDSGTPPPSRKRRHRSRRPRRRNTSQPSREKDQSNRQETSESARAPKNQSPDNPPAKS